MATWLLDILHVTPALLNNLKTLIQLLRPTILKGSLVDAYFTPVSSTKARNNFLIFWKTFQEMNDKVQLLEKARVTLLWEASISRVPTS